MTDLTVATQACIDYIRDVGGVSFAELEKILERHGVPARGDYCVEFPTMPNMLLWMGMSEEFIDIAQALDKHPDVDWKPTSTLVYIADGRCPMAPLAKRPRKGGYKKPHWLPVVFNWTKPRTRQERLDGARRALKAGTP